MKRKIFIIVVFIISFCGTSWAARHTRANFNFKHFDNSTYEKNKRNYNR